MSVVYVTASKTFDGPIAGYSTDMPPSALDTPVPSVADTPPPAIFPGPTTTAIPASVLAASSASSLAAKSSFESRMSAARNPTHGLSSSSSMSVGHAIHSTAASSSTSMSVGHAIHSTKASSSSAAFTNTGLEASAPTASQAQPTQESSSGGMSGGAKAGLAIGLILAIGLVLGLVFFCYRRRKSQTGHQKLDDEKSQMQQAPPPLIPRVSIRRPGRDDAPRLSLRPVTGLFPDSNTNEKQAMAGNNTTLQAPAAAHAKPTPWERSAALPSVTEASNPFGDHAELVGSAAGAGAIDAAAMPKPLNVSRPSTPTGQSSPSMQHAAPGSPGPAAGPGGPMNVHRVQLDFPPSMEDELELRAGQLVRMLHEYDDGWVSFLPQYYLFQTNNIRLSASASTALSKVLSLAAASPNSQSSHVPPVPLPQALADLPLTDVPSAQVTPA